MSGRRRELKTSLADVLKPQPIVERVMRTVEITYRYGGPAALVRPRPADADAARLRLDEGNRAFAGLLDTLATDSGTARRTIDVDPGDLGLLPGESSAETPPVCGGARLL